ncbi:MAG: hypothetical protein JWR21_960 [Herminiimonas sp.]|nr:hypothetical protein [Herminiimonas sp.]
MMWPALSLKRPQLVAGAMLLAACAFLASCGGGGSDGGNAAPPATTVAASTVTSPVANDSARPVAPPVPALAARRPVVQLTFDESEIAATATTRLSWSATEAESCMASGSWSGVQPSSGSIQIPANGTGFYPYRLTCTNALGTSAGAAMLSVIGASRNVARITVGRSLFGNAINIPYVDVTVCQPGTTTCQTIDHVLLDTGSTGLRLIAPGVLRTDLDLPRLKSTSSKSLANCVQFADGSYLWGSLRTADVSIAGQTAQSITIQEAGDPATDFASIPGDCVGLRNGGSVAALGVRGILGIGTLKVDCAGCVADIKQKRYFECDGTGCAPATVTLGQLLSNPVAGFATDNNGMSVIFPPVPDSGVTSLSGALVFGIDTQSNNRLGTATAMRTSAIGALGTKYLNKTYASLLDTGSNSLVLPDAFLPTCINNPLFVCPVVEFSQSAILRGLDGVSSFAIDFLVRNFEKVSASVIAVLDATVISTTEPLFVWGLPAFFGRTVFFALDGANAGGKVGPYVALYEQTPHP